MFLGSFNSWRICHHVLQLQSVIPMAAISKFLLPFSQPVIIGTAPELLSLSVMTPWLRSALSYLAVVSMVKKYLWLIT